MLINIKDSVIALQKHVAIEYSFTSKLLITYVVRFEYFKACGAVLKVPNVASGFHWCAERVRLISQQSNL